MNTYNFRLEAVASKAAGKLIAVPMVNVTNAGASIDTTIEAYKASLNEDDKTRFQVQVDAWEAKVGLADKGKDALVNVKNLDKLKATRAAKQAAIDAAQAELSDLSRQIAVAEVLYQVANSSKV